MSWNWTWTQFKCKRLSEFETQLSYPTFSTTWTLNIPVPWQSLAVTPIDSENVGWFSFGKTWNVSTSQWVTTLWSCESPPNTLGTKCDTLKVSEHLFHSHILASFSNLIHVNSKTLCLWEGNRCSSGRTALQSVSWSTVGDISLPFHLLF